MQTWKKESAMHDKILQHLSNRIQTRYKKGFKITTRKAVTFSLVLHLFLGIAFAAMNRDKIAGLMTAKEENIEFELVTLKDLDLKSNTSRKGNLQSTSSAKKAGKKVGLSSSTSKELVAENVRVNKEAVMLASLASLSELQESFQFLIQELSVDEEGIFTPIQGDVPDTKVIADGLVNAKGFGGRRGIISISGGGSGKCPPRPRP
jgi:hypothetical protein